MEAQLRNELSASSVIKDKCDISSGIQRIILELCTETVGGSSLISGTTMQIMNESARYGKILHGFKTIL